MLGVSIGVSLKLVEQFKPVLCDSGGSQSEDAGKLIDRSRANNRQMLQRPIVANQIAGDSFLFRGPLAPAFQALDESALFGGQWAQLDRAALRSHADSRRGDAMTEPEIVRCRWVGIAEPIYQRYHDEEWGVPHANDRAMFEKLVLEGFQAGLSWLTILKKRENFRRAFHGFDPERIARYGAKDVARLMADPGIVRNRLKVQAFVLNARAFLDTVAAHGTFDRYIWQFAPSAKRRKRPRYMSDFVVSSPESRRPSSPYRSRRSSAAPPTAAAVSSNSRTAVHVLPMGRIVQ